MSYDSKVARRRCDLSFLPLCLCASVVSPKCRSAPVSRVLFPVRGDDHSSGPAIARRLVRPNPRDYERAAHPPIWPCTGWGLACARGHPLAGGLLPHHFTLTLSGGLFSVPLSADHSAPSLTAILPYGARTFLSAKRSDRPAHSRHYKL